MLKKEVAKLKAEMEATMKAIEGMKGKNPGLENEIATYRALLDGQENRSDVKSKSKAG